MDKEAYIKYKLMKMSDLDESSKNLLRGSKEAMENAFAPYSEYKVGCAILLENGKIVTGSNQENASFPAGICAERVGLSAASSFYPGVPVNAIAIATSNSDENLAAPCGICRQSILEYEVRFKKNISILMQKKDEVYLFESVKELLPFAFDRYVFKK